jgi:hypothetical protein
MTLGKAKGGSQHRIQKFTKQNKIRFNNYLLIYIAEINSLQIISRNDRPYPQKLLNISENISCSPNNPL